MIKDALWKTLHHEPAAHDIVVARSRASDAFPYFMSMPAGEKQQTQHQYFKSCWSILLLFLAARKSRRGIFPRASSARRRASGVWPAFISPWLRRGVRAIASRRLYPSLRVLDEKGPPPPPDGPCSWLPSLSWWFLGVLRPFCASWGLLVATAGFP